MSVRRRLGLRPLFDRLDDRCLLSGLTPGQVTSAYGLDAIRFNAPSGGIGQGRWLRADNRLHRRLPRPLSRLGPPHLRSDLRPADAEADLVNQAGARTDDGWAAEETLDVEWAHAIAPGANILVVEAAPRAFPDMMAAVYTARDTPGVVGRVDELGFRGDAERDLVRRLLHDARRPPGHHVRRGQRRRRGPRGGLSRVVAERAAVGGTRSSSAGGGYNRGSAWAGSGGGLESLTRRSRATRRRAVLWPKHAGRRFRRRSEDRRLGLPDPAAGPPAGLVHRGRDEPGRAGLGRDHRHGRSGPCSRGQGNPGRAHPDACPPSMACLRRASTPWRPVRRLEGQAASPSRTGRRAGSAPPPFRPRARRARPTRRRTRLSSRAGRIRSLVASDTTIPLGTASGGTAPTTPGKSTHPIGRGQASQASLPRAQETRADDPPDDGEARGPSPASRREGSW